MLKLFLLSVVLLNTILSFATEDYAGPLTDTVKPGATIRQVKDSNILVVIDEKIISEGKNIKSIDDYVKPDSISYVNVLKGQSAIDKYGSRANNGAVEIFTKKNKETQEKFFNAKIPEPESDFDIIFEKVDIEATFPGGDQAWRKYLEKTLKADVPVDHGAPVGLYTTLIQFVVDKDGNISDVKALTNLGYGMEEEVISVIKKGPKWKPASQNGKMVKAYRKQPVTFMVDDESISVIAKKGYTLNAGEDNLVRIEMYKVKDNDLEFNISEGSITRISEGQFNIRVENAGRIILTIINAKKKNESGRVSFDVK
ncbi:MAG: energy transducer TonB [Chitinophagaceae bacterium]